MDNDIWKNVLIGSTTAYTLSNLSAENQWGHPLAVGSQ